MVQNRRDKRMANRRDKRMANREDKRMANREDIFGTPSYHPRQCIVWGTTSTISATMMLPAVASKAKNIDFIRIGK